MNFSRSEISVKRRYEPTLDETDTWRLLKTVDKEIKAAKTLDQSEQFCSQASNNLILMAGTDYASAALTSSSKEIKGSEIIINPSRRSNQLASTLEALELIQTFCKLPEALILRSQILILQRFGIISVDKFEKEDLPCVYEACVEDDEMDEIIGFIRFNASLMLLLTISIFLVPLLIEQKTQTHELLEINESTNKPKTPRIVKTTLTTIAMILELSVLSLPSHIYKSVVC